MHCWRAFESVWSELLKKDQSGHPNLWKAPNYDVHQIWPSRKLVSNYILKKQWLRLSLRTIEYATNTYKKYFYTFRINKIIFTNGERKKERPNFYRMFSQNLQISTAFIVILKMELPQGNAIGVRTPPGINPLPLWITRKTAFILINQNWVIFSCILLSRLPSFRHSKEPGFWLEVQSCPLSPVLHQQLMMG